MADALPRLARLSTLVREFWTHHERKFIEVWKVLDSTGKTKLATAAVSACQQMTNQGSLLIPEINIEEIVNDVNHVPQLFWYYYTDDGMERDRTFISELNESNTLNQPVEQAITLRQMAILSFLGQLMELYHTLWSQQPNETNDDEELKHLEGVFAEYAASFENSVCLRCRKQNSNSVCSRCKKVKYCGKECFAQDWSEHKKYCIAPSQNGDIDHSKNAILRKKLNKAKKNAQDRASKGVGSKIRNR